MSSERKTCTADSPMPANDSGRWEHPDAVYLAQRDGYPGGDIVDYCCPHCKKEFSIELPQ